MPKILKDASTSSINDRGFHQPRIVLLIVFQRLFQDLLPGHGILGTVRLCNGFRYIIIRAEEMMPHLQHVMPDILRVVALQTSKELKFIRSSRYPITTKVNIAILLNEVEV